MLDTVVHLCTDAPSNLPGTSVVSCVSVDNELGRISNLHAQLENICFCVVGVASNIVSQAVERDRTEGSCANLLARYFLVGE